jgi:long-chain fatty acid transport protein
VKRGLLVAAALAVPAPAHASPLFELAGDAGGRGSLIARISTDGPAAAYFNPALLVDGAPGLTLGSFVLGENFGITLDGRSSSAACTDDACDVPSGAGRGPESFRHEGTGEPISEPTLPTRWLEDGTDDLSARPRQARGSGHNTRAYQTVGLLTKVLRGRLSLGLYAMIPLGEFTTAKAFYNDEREQFFSNSLHPELYSDRLTATSLAFGGAMRVHRTVAVGATFTLSLSNGAAVPVYVSNLNDLDTLLVDSDVGVKAAVAPHFGVVWDPLARLRVTGTVHTPQAFDIDTGFDYVLATGIEQSAELHFTHSYMPVKVASGARYRLAGDGVTRALWLTGGTAWARWSKYKDRHGERPSPDYRWSNTLSGAAGVAYQRADLTGQVDVEYAPSPVPPQTGRSNYVDNDRIGVTLGGNWAFRKWGSRFQIGLTMMAHHLLEQRTTKFLPPDDSNPELVRDEIPDDSIDVLGAPVEARDGLQTNNPGFPGYSSIGWIIGGGVRFVVEY